MGLATAAYFGRVKSITPPSLGATDQKCSYRVSHSQEFIGIKATDAQTRASVRQAIASMVSV
jgi:hypothetical protein